MSKSFLTFPLLACLLSLFFFHCHSLSLCVSISNCNLCCKTGCHWHKVWLCFSVKVMSGVPVPAHTLTPAPTPFLLKPHRHCENLHLTTKCQQKLAARRREKFIANQIRNMTLYEKLWSGKQQVKVTCLGLLDLRILYNFNILYAFISIYNK